MKIINANVEQISPYIPEKEYLQHIERIARVCYKSEGKITDPDTTTLYADNIAIEFGDEKASCYQFVQNLIKNGHEAMIEHGPSISMKFICDRGVSHELVRHRLFSFAQESTRYCNYGHQKEITVIKPCFLEESSLPYVFWKTACTEAQDYYLALLEKGCSPQEARTVLPNSLKTEIVVTGNIREWRHFFKLRMKPNAHPQMIEVARMAFNILYKQLPCIFNDIGRG